VHVQLKGDAIMKTTICAVALGATMLLTGSWGTSAQEGLFTSMRDCTTDIQSLCAGVKPGGGRILACLQQHVAAGQLSVGCSTILSKAIWVAKECAGDIRQFAPAPRIQTSASACNRISARRARPASRRWRSWPLPPPIGIEANSA
jgi:hypothetical protein